MVSENPLVVEDPEYHEFLNELLDFYGCSDHYDNSIHNKLSIISEMRENQIKKADKIACDKFHEYLNTLSAEELSALDIDSVMYGSGLPNYGNIIYTDEDQENT